MVVGGIFSLDELVDAAAHCVRMEVTSHAVGQHFDFWTGVLDPVLSHFASIYKTITCLSHKPQPH